MFSYDQILKALRAEGLKVVEVPGSRGRCRCHNGPHSAGGPQARAFAPSGDVMVHITAGGLGSRTPLQYIADIINGDPNIPAKSQFVTDPKGVVYLNSAGRCNHAGNVGSRAVRASLRQELSLDGYVGNLRGSDADGNREWYGIENIAASSMTNAQRESSVRICAALSRLAKRSGRGTLGHGEASANRAYADPNLDMGKFRRDVIARVKAGPAGSINQEDDMSAAAEKKIDEIHDSVRQGQSGKFHHGAMFAAVRDLQQRARSTGAQLTALTAAVDALAKAKGTDPKVITAAVTKSVDAALKDYTLTLGRVDDEDTK